MFESTIRSTYVSHVVPVGFADAVEVADGLAGEEIRAGKARLQVGARIGDGLAGAVWYSGVLRTGSSLVPPVKVDLVVSPWSAGRTEIGVRPLSRIGRPESYRAGRFFDAAWALLPRLMERLTDASVPAPAAKVFEVAA